ncbi:conserved hypothetical protein [Gloeothece citriformis PCC 7424]|uniref:Uncharacterized protein n=1 Tax=Gloeothece citriformis (strain PCC 7424) TaxID=65393 RepID=B7KJQ3_GLOC7|nr:hypothetical protein [Gloeothece citriformis]ACK69502.1 conserved hypothetical protein [Gloeothece citriformis PCC 7424]
MSESNKFPTSPNPPHLLPKVIYSPQEWSDCVELEPTPQQPISAELVEPIDLSFSETSSETPTENDVYSYNPQSEQLTENIDWFTLAHKLGQQNRELLKTVVELEQALAESQHQLQHQKLRAQNAEALLTQQTQQLTQTQGKRTQLIQELEQAQQLAQNQQVFIETLTQQLENTQHQTANLERECAFLKEDNNTKTQKLIFLEEQIQEFRSRLFRQQRYTLQYKAALDQCLNFPLTEIDNSLTVSSITSKEKSIQPWSSNSQTISPLSLSDSNSTLNSLEDVFFQPITVSFQEKDFDSTPDPNLLNSNPNTDEDEVDAFLDEFFASFEPEESPQPEPISKRVSSDWPSPVISPISSGQKSSSKIIDLPKFVRK